MWQYKIAGLGPNADPAEYEGHDSSVETEKGRCLCCSREVVDTLVILAGTDLAILTLTI